MEQAAVASNPVRSSVAAFGPYTLLMKLLVRMTAE